MKVTFEKRTIKGKRAEAEKVYCVKEIEPARTVKVPAVVVAQPATDLDKETYAAEYEAFVPKKKK